MSAAPAYSAYSAPARRSRYTRQTSRPDISVVPGKQPRKSADQKTQVNFIPIVATVVVFALVVFAIASFARIAINSAAVMESIQTKQLTNQISSARAEGNKLEVSESALSSASRMKAQAETLGLAAPVYSETIIMPIDVVQTDEAGSLSLSKSVAAAAEQ